MANNKLWFHYTLPDGYRSGFNTLQGTMESASYEMLVRNQQSATIYVDVEGHTSMVCNISVDVVLVKMLQPSEVFNAR